MTASDRSQAGAALAVVVVVVSAAARLSLGHDHTRDQAAARSAAIQARAEAEASRALARLADGETCRLTIELSDQGESRPGLVRVLEAASGKPLALTDGIHRARNWYVVPRSGTVRVPRTKLRVEAFYGLETETAALDLDLTGRESAVARLPLARFADFRAQGLRSGNTHLHLMKLTRDEAERYLREVPAADGLDLVFLSYLLRAEADREYISNAFSRDDLARLSRSGPVLFENGEEHRHNFGPGGEGYGHVMFLRLEQLILPVSIGPGIMKEGTDGIPLRRGIVQARRQGAGVIWCHNTFGLEDLPNWLAGLLDAQNIFDGGNHGHYADTFYRYLDLGMKVPFSTGTDWFLYDFARVYVPIEGELTSRRWLDALAAGRSTITNGPLLTFSVEGQGPGASLAVAAPRTLRVLASGVGRCDFQAIELVHNGQVVHRAASRPERGHFAAGFAFDLNTAEPGWLALRVPVEAGTNELDQPLFAHTSPVYLERNGQRRFRREEAERVRAELEQSVAAIERQAVFADESEREAVLRVYRDGLRQLEALIEARAQR